MPATPYGPPSPPSSSMPAQTLQSPWRSPIPCPTTITTNSLPSATYGCMSPCPPTPGCTYPTTVHNPGADHCYPYRPMALSRIAGRLLLQHTLAATQCLTIYSTTSSHGYYWSNAYVNIAVPWYLYHHTYVSNAIPWQLHLYCSELTTYEQIVC